MSQLQALLVDPAARKIWPVNVSTDDPAHQLRELIGSDLLEPYAFDLQHNLWTAAPDLFARKPASFTAAGREFIGRSILIGRSPQGQFESAGYSVHRLGYLIDWK
jgi:hypothetical protein